MRLTFDKKDSVECHRARRMVEDMLRRGYAIFVQVGKDLVPVRRFDAAKAEYLITDVPGGGEGEVEREPVPAKPDSCSRCQQPRHRGRCRLKPLPLEKTKAIAVGRSAGG